MSDIEIEHHRLLDSNKQAIVAKFGDAFSENAAVAIFREVCRLVAERYVAENYQEIVKLISPDAIATLSAAEAAAKIRETLEKKIPDKVLEVTRTETQIYQRGILGGLKRMR